MQQLSLASSFSLSLSFDAVLHKKDIDNIRLLKSSFLDNLLNFVNSV